MTATFFQSWAGPLFIVGMFVSAIGWVWFLFASYRADPYVARWSKFLPLPSIRMALEHRETCLKPFILQHVGLLFCVPQILHAVAAISL